jgi:hypothetical protein
MAAMVRRAALGLAGAVTAGRVLPERRGNGRAAGILAEITGMLAVGASATALRTGIDRANQSTAVAPDRLGYRSPWRRLVHWPPRDA